MSRSPARRPRRLAPRRLIVAALAAATGCSNDAERSPDAVLTVVAVAATPCTSPNRDRGLGVAVGDGLVATAGHTVEGPRREVTVDGVAATVLVVDPRTDLAILRTSLDAAVLPPPAMSDAFADTARRATVRTGSDDLTVDVIATGQLIVDDTTDRQRYEREVHTLAPGVPAGTSGAPLADTGGRLLGIVVLANRTDDTSYAVTARELRALIERATATNPDAPSPSPCPG